MKQNLKERVNGKNGITLIALVITIIVLLILAGVTIATLTGENGILTRVQSTKTQNEKKHCSAPCARHGLRALRLRRRQGQRRQRFRYVQGRHDHGLR